MRKVLCLNCGFVVEGVALMAVGRESPGLPELTLGREEAWAVPGGKERILLHRGTPQRGTFETSFFLSRYSRGRYP